MGVQSSNADSSNDAQTVMAAQPARLCIISREPLQSAHFIAALQASLGPDDLLEIIFDRRQGGASGKADLTEDRRRQHKVAIALAVNGFAIVPTPGDPPEDRSWRPRPSLLSVDVPPIKRASPLLEVPPIEQSSAVDDEDQGPERIANSQRRRPRTRIPKLFGLLIGVTLIALVLLLAGQLSGQSRLGQLLTDPLRGRPERPPNQPIVAEAPPAARPDRETNAASEVAGTASQEPSTAPNETSTATRGASAPADETGAPPHAGTGKDARDARSGSGPGATARQGPSAPPRSSSVAGVPSPGAAASQATSTQVVEAQRAELVGAPISRGWGDSYAVRVLDSAGQPMVDAGVFLVARMADGTVENIPMGALTERGIYRGTVPTSRSTPVDFRVRVTTGGRSIEIPVRP